MKKTIIKQLIGKLIIISFVRKVEKKTQCVLYSPFFRSKIKKTDTMEIFGGYLEQNITRKNRKQAQQCLQKRGA